MRPIKTLKDALDTIERGFVVDQAENKVPIKVVESLRFGQRRHVRQGKGYPYRSHCRYDGGKEIWWFCE